MTLERWSRPDLAALVREHLLAGHLIDRAGMPQVVAELGLDGMRDVAIDEWMAASPIYTRRMQRALGIDGDDVATIFKGMQLDIGAPPQFMDFRYSVSDAAHGEFRLASCGALMDVEPMGDDFVVAMCHHIEDPTFDATAWATNPRARVRPVHRPPRVPADRHPHCHWTVEIVDDAEPLPEPDATAALAASPMATIELGPIVPGAGGRDSYAGALEDDLDLAAFSSSALLRILDEVCLQGQLLARAFMLAVASRTDAATAARLGTKQLTGVAGLVARRLARHLGVDGGLEGLAQVLEVHPALRPAPCVSATVERGDDRLVVRVDAMVEDDGLSWSSLLLAGAEEPMAAIAQAVDPRTRVERAGDATWDVWLADDEPPLSQPPEVTLASFSTGADFRFH